MDWQGMALTASVWVLPVLIAVTFHEAAHGWVAWRLGDDTAYRMGRERSIRSAISIPSAPYCCRRFYCLHLADG